MPTILILEQHSDEDSIESLVDSIDGHTLISAHSIQKAMSYLASTPVDVILADTKFEDGDAILFMDRLHKEKVESPLILVLNPGCELFAFEALERNAASFILREHLYHELSSKISLLLASSSREMRRKKLIGQLQSSQAVFCLENDPAMISPAVGRLQESLVLFKICSEEDVTRAGIALEEAITNAMYHGNLEVSSSLKDESDYRFRKQVEENRLVEPYKHRKVLIKEMLDLTGATFIVRDEGPGFNPHMLPDPLSEEQLLKPYGRGLLMIQNFMDEVTFNEKGNEIKLVKYSRHHKGCNALNHFSSHCQPEQSEGAESPQECTTV